jgi:YfiH family protein
MLSSRNIFYTMAIFSNHPQVITGVSEKDDGSCRLWPDGALNQRSFKNRERFFHRIGVSPANVLGALPTHSNNVMTVGPNDRGRIFAGVDGFVTAAPDVFLSVTAADCLPVFLYDPVRQAVGLLHAGWRGLQNGVVAAGIRKMQSLGSDPRNILAALGPGIGPCHFEVQPDLLPHFESYLSEALQERGGKQFLDLKAIAAAELKEAGLALGHIQVESECTACLPDRYFSYRRDKPPILEVMVAVIGLLPASNTLT